MWSWRSSFVKLRRTEIDRKCTLLVETAIAWYILVSNTCFNFRSNEDLWQGSPDLFSIIVRFITLSRHKWGKRASQPITILSETMYYFLLYTILEIRLHHPGVLKWPQMLHGLWFQRLKLSSKKSSLSTSNPENFVNLTYMTRAVT